jgi:hypothetical protein
MQVQPGGAAGIRPQGAKERMPNNVGGEQFANIQAFLKALNGGPAILPPGTSVKIQVGQMGIGGAKPSVQGLTKAFKASYDDQGNLVIKAHKHAPIGSTAPDAYFQQGPPPGTKTPVAFAVEPGFIQIG